MADQPLALTAYLAAGRVADQLAWMLLRRRLRRGKEDPARIGERRGFPSKPRPEGAVIWLHGASVGETASLLPLIPAFGKIAPKAVCLVTSGTVASAAQMEKRLPELLPIRAIHQYAPVDTAASVRRFLDHWRPDLAIFVESELWPCLTTETAARGIPMALVNARISEVSARKWSRAPRAIRHMLSLFRMIVAQDRETVERMTTLGVAPHRVRIGGNLKALVRPPPPRPEDLEAMRRALAGRPVWLAASTHPDEEEVMLDAHLALPSDTVLILAPRHPERGDAIAKMIERRGFEILRISRGDCPDDRTMGAARVLLADVIGRMGLWLQLAPVTFVGGSLVPVGGHTPFEPAQVDSAILHGPHTANFAPAYASLAKAGGAVSVSSAEDLARRVGELLENDSTRGKLTEAARILFRNAPDPEDLARRLAALAPRLHG